MALAQQFEELLLALSVGMPVHEIMRKNERNAGFDIILPGDVSWLPSIDWDPTIVVSKNCTYVRLVAILAKKPGCGALGRAIAGILSDGLKPVIVEPTREMQATCKRWGWRCRRIGRGIESQEVWYPREFPR